jgi:hypothetical protein
MLRLNCQGGPVFSVNLSAVLCFLFRVSESRIPQLAPALLLLTAAVSAQNVQAVISGTCRDETGLAIQGAAVVFRNVETGWSRSTVTGPDGRFQGASLALGEYRIEASKAGFRSEARGGVMLHVGREAVIDFTLRVSQMEERIEIVAEASMVETSSPAVSGLADAKKVSDLPLNGRDIVQLIQMQTGVQSARTDGGDIVTGSKGTRIVVAGARSSMNVFMLDGTVMNNLGNRVAGGATGNLTGVETIREFRAYTNGYSAEFSRAAGGAFNIVTKSGTNSLHGSVFEFLRNDNLDARNFFDGARPEFQRNQFGFSIGGPLARNRAFYFASYEGFRERLGQTVIRTVPDVEARQGILSGVQIPVAASVRPYLGLWPAQTSDPTPGDGSALYTSLFSRPVSEDLVNVRVDHQLTSSGTLFARYTGSTSWQNFLSDETFPQFPNRLSNHPQFLTVQEAHVLSPSAMNELRAGFARSNPYERMIDEQVRPDLAFIPGEALGVLNISGLDFFGPDRNTPRRLTQNSYQLSDQFTLARTRHTLSAGVQFERLQYNVVSASQLRGEFRFAGFADFLRAQASTFEGVMPGAKDFTRGYRQSLAGFYVQDSLRLSRRLVLYLGLRHEFVTVPTEQHGRLNNLRHYLDAGITMGSPFVTEKAALTPRAGFAWDPRGDGKTALRGGLGVFTVPFLGSQWWNSIVRLSPYTVTARATGAEARFPNPLEGLNPLGRESISAIEYDHLQPYMLHFNLSLQREVMNSTLLSLAYVGSRGIHLGREADFNIGAPGNPVRRNPAFARIRFRTWDARSFYNSLQVGLQRRFRSRLQAQVSYSFSKSVDDASSEMGRLEFNNGQSRTSDPFDRLRDRGLSSFDVRNNLVSNFTWDIPWRPHRAGWLFNGWQLSGILSLSGGIPFTPIIVPDLDRDGTDDNEQRPNLRPGASKNPVLGRPEQWFDPAAFSSIASGTRGSLGRNTIVGPGLAAFDLGAAKSFPFPRWETVKLQFRAEAFNIFNRPNFATPPRTNLELFSQAGEAARPLPNAGRLTSTSTTSRQIQLALRLIF